MSDGTDPRSPDEVIARSAGDAADRAIDAARRAEASARRSDSNAETVMFVAIVVAVMAYVTYKSANRIKEILQEAKVLP